MGLRRGLTALQKPVVAELARLRTQYPSATLFVTGHSLGAAVALIAAYSLHFDLGFEVGGAYTYGSPRVGNQQLTSFIGGKSAPAGFPTWRITHGRDPVPHLPPRWVGFEHVSTEVFLPFDNRSHVVCDGSGEDKNCSNSLVRSFGLRSPSLLRRG